jgi:hypothetical protein
MRRPRSVVCASPGEGSPTIWSAISRSEAQLLVVSRRSSAPKDSGQFAPVELHQAAPHAALHADRVVPRALRTSSLTCASRRICRPAALLGPKGLMAPL